MEKVLVSWIGEADLTSASANIPASGPISSTLSQLSFDRVVLLCSYPASRSTPYFEWLQRQTNCLIEHQQAKLVSPVHFESIYLSANGILQSLTDSQSAISILLSPGTPAMQAIWILLGKARYPVTFYQSSKEQGVQRVDIPFDISAEYRPLATQLNSQQFATLSFESEVSNAAFENIVTQNPHLQRLKHQAHILADRDVPVLIQGETGTGKELFARAIHNASARSGKPFVPVNCGAFPTELVDSILFGHKKGAFTGAIADRQGYFQQASGGTLFLDEFGELEPSVQVRLLRVLQEGVIMPVGATKEETVDVRIITATHRNLMQAIQEGQFREDLFYRVAVGVLTLPPLRERQGDVILLAQALLQEMAKQDVALKNKKISTNAKNIILAHAWPGNIRELRSTLLRASLWSSEEEISAEDIEQALFERPQNTTRLLDRDISQGIDIQDIISEIVKHYIPKALAHSNGSKSKAAELLGLKNYQTLTNWMDKYNVK
ncbi:sigma-54 interaction domain-containing protein [Marinomonas profundi]|uniref:sigma-54 interaction domain-containing protein n=1 Tax=Marinomonas profundi TaxID=2726122 RepID=UPI001D105FD7|nr:sigma 54-interacting transcriptional regulator [Marinomonas profundi]